MSFWNSGTGNDISGTPEMAFLKEFSVIPNNTMALARIVSFDKVEKQTLYADGPEKYLSILWKIEKGDYRGREITQKIKCFTGKPEQIDRALNMLMLIMKLCDHKQMHYNEPSSDELQKMNGKVLGIKIREWSMPKADGSGISEGNFVSEVHPIEGFIAEVGIKLEPIVSFPVDSALSRNSDSKSGPSIEDELPF